MAATSSDGRGHRPRLFDLINDVVEGGSCSQCGACVVACPYGILTYESGEPQAWDGPSKHHEVADMIIGGRPEDFCPISENVGCDCCASVCPKLELPKERLEQEMFGRTATEEERIGLGVYETLEFTRTRDLRVKSTGQDGGFVTSLLVWALREGIIDGAVVTTVDPKEPAKPMPFVATTEKDILRSAGSWYTYSPNTLGLIEAAQMGLKRVAFVGTPCQITPVRRMQGMHGGDLDTERLEPNERNYLRQYEHLTGVAKIIAFTVGLLCSETFVYEGLMKKHIQGTLGIPLSDVTKFNIKGKVLVHRKSGEVVEFPLKDAFPYARPQCSFCGDFASEEADISAGGVGTNGWTLTMARTKLGVDLYERFKATRIIEVKPVDEFAKAVAIARKLAQKQRLRQQEAYAAKSRGETPQH